MKILNVLKYEISLYCVEILPCGLQYIVQCDCRWQKTEDWHTKICINVAATLSLRNDIVLLLFVLYRKNEKFIEMYSEF